MKLPFPRRAEGKGHRKHSHRRFPGPSEGFRGPLKASGGIPGPGAEMQVFDPVQNKSNLIVHLLIIIVVFGLDFPRHFGGPPGLFWGRPEIAFSSMGKGERPSRALPPKTLRAFRGSLEIAFSSTGRGERPSRACPRSPETAFSSTGRGTESPEIAFSSTGRG